MNIWKKTK